MENITKLAPKEYLIKSGAAIQKAYEYAEQSKSCNTRKAYSSDWKHFNQWCIANTVIPLPAASEDLILYVTIFAGTLKVSTLSRRLTAIAEAHRVAGFKSPLENETLQMVWKGIRRTKGIHQQGKMPLMTDDLRTVLSNFRADIKGIRDRALLLLGFSGGFRRSELVALNVSDLQFVTEGVMITIQRSKSDQEGAGMYKAIPFGSSPELCPVRALQAWLRASAICEGPLFRSIGKSGRLHSERLSDKAVALVIKDVAQSKGLNVAKYSGHSLRSGFVTQAAQNGASDQDIMNTTGHKSRAMVSRYTRSIDAWKNNAAARLGL